MMICTLCGIKVESLNGFEIVRLGNRSTTVLDKDGLGHNFTKIQDTTSQSLNARRVNHARYHVARKIRKWNCSLCQIGD